MDVSVQLRRLAPSEWQLYRELRVASVQDMPSAFLATLEQLEAMTPEAWRRRLSERTCFVAEEDGKAVGLASGTGTEVPGVAELNSVWVAPAHRGGGVADQLIAAVLDWARRVGYDRLRLAVVDDNARAIAFYARAGFQPTGRTLPYPKDPARHELELMTQLT